MKFLVSDTQSDRHRAIRSYLTPQESSIAVLLGAADLEWTIRRTIYCLGTTPIAELKAQRVSSLDRYAGLWRRELRARGIPTLQAVIGEWQELLDAFDLRHRLIHGAQGGAGVAYAGRRVERMLAASEAIATVAKEHGANLYKRLRRIG
jgi:hypothetical protein